MLDFITVNTHSSIRISDSKIIYIDPFKIDIAVNDADIILVTHPHFDHFSPDDICKVMKDDTVLVCPESMKEADELGITVKYVGTNDNFSICGIDIETIPAYNKLKPFHKKSNGWIGYIINSNENGRIYIAGDTDITDENKKVICSTAIVPIGGTYTMSADKAAELVNIIKPQYAVPVHYGSIVGTPDDAEVFRKNVNDEIKVINKI